MSSGGFRSNSGRPRKGSELTVITEQGATTSNLTPLDFLLGIVNNEGESQENRMRAAIAALPYCHAKPSESKPSAREKKAASVQKILEDNPIFRPLVLKRIENQGAIIPT